MTSPLQLNAERILVHCVVVAVPLCAAYASVAPFQVEAQDVRLFDKQKGPSISSAVPVTCNSCISLRSQSLFRSCCTAVVVYRRQFLDPGAQKSPSHACSPFKGRHVAHIANDIAVASKKPMSALEGSSVWLMLEAGHTR